MLYVFKLKIFYRLNFCKWHTSNKFLIIIFMYMDVLLAVILIVALTGLIFSFLSKQRKNVIITTPFPETYRDILTKQVPFYQQLDENNKNEFEKRIQQFLGQVRITGVKTTVEDL